MILFQKWHYGLRMSAGILKVVSDSFIKLISKITTSKLAVTPLCSVHPVSLDQCRILVSHSCSTSFIYFLTGLRVYGKDFRQIQKNKVSKRHLY